MQVLSCNIMIIFPSAEALNLFSIKLFRNGSLINGSFIKMSLVFSEDKAIVCGHMNHLNDAFRVIILSFFFFGARDM